MLKNFIKFFFFTCIFISYAMAFSNNSDVNAAHNLTIQLGNLSLTKTNLPKHDFSYEMTIPDTEISKGAPLTGTISPDNMDITSVIYRFDFNNIEVNLNISDPAIGKRIIWKGKIVYNTAFERVESMPEVIDNLHYGIYINVVQPKQGRPQLIIGIVSI